MNRPIAIGLGCDRGTPAATLVWALVEALGSCGAALVDVAAVASIDLKADEPGLLELARWQGWTIRFYPAAELAELADTAGVTAAATLMQRVKAMNPKFILGKGKLLQTPVPQSADVARPVQSRRKSQGSVARSHTLQGQPAPQLRLGQQKPYCGALRQPGRCPRRRTAGRKRAGCAIASGDRCIAGA